MTTRHGLLQHYCVTANWACRLVVESSPAQTSKSDGSAIHCFVCGFVVWGYLLFKARALDGQPLISDDDFSFSVEMLHASQTTDEALYDTTTEFHYDLMPVQLQSLVDSTIPSWNNSLVRMREQRNKRTNRSQEGTPTEDYDFGGRSYSTQNNAIALSNSDLVQILGLALRFTEFILK